MRKVDLRVTLVRIITERVRRPLIHAPAARGALIREQTRGAVPPIRIIEVRRPAAAVLSVQEVALLHAAAIVQAVVLPALRVEVPVADAGDNLIKVCNRKSISNV